MKRLNSFAVVLVLTVGAFFFGSANQSVAGSDYYSRGGDGLLRMKHSPVLGINIPIDVWIDGMHSGCFAKGHVFERSLAPGRHMVYASRPGRQASSFYGPIDVQPGETRSFVVKSTLNQVYLIPVGRVD